MEVLIELCTKTLSEIQAVPVDHKKGGELYQ
ncbi:hypothetical protein LINGRAHAP2_LOCUS19623 [Linum grandiflorum]